MYDSILDTAASQAGMTVSSCILKVGDRDAITLRHDDVVKEIKSSLDKTGASSERTVSLKLSLPFMEKVSHYRYEGQQGESMEVHERLVESPYTFDVPAQVSLGVCCHGNGYLDDDNNNNSKKKQEWRFD